jgi:hypothetical protein
VVQAARTLNTDVTVVSLEPTTIADILANIGTVGELTGRLPEAKALVQSLGARLDALGKSLSGVTRRPRTLVLEWLEPPFAPGHWVPQQVSVAGGDAGFGIAGGASRTTTAEEISAYAPEVIVLAPCGFTPSTRCVSCPEPNYPAAGQDCPRSETATYGYSTRPRISVDRGPGSSTAPKSWRASCTLTWSAHPSRTTPCACHPN